eukprot:SAG22_NODE_15794_length_340_cov_0.863071_2_plen_30_part_01
MWFRCHSFVTLAALLAASVLVTAQMLRRPI